MCMCKYLHAYMYLNQLKPEQVLFEISGVIPKIFYKIINSDCKFCKVCELQSYSTYYAALTKPSHQFIFSITLQIMITVLVKLHLTCQCCLFTYVKTSGSCIRLQSIN